MMTQRQTMEQGRARQAQQCVDQAKKAGPKMAKEYASLVRSAPANVQASGLGQTLAFWRSKVDDKKKGNGEDAHDHIYRHVSQWVCGQMKGWQNGELLPMLIAEETSMTDYRRATEEAMAFLVWLKRFAEAELKMEGD